MRTKPSGLLRRGARPTNWRPYLQEDEMKLYRLIWMRFVASQMMPAVFDQTTIDVAAKGKDGANYMFRATGSVPKFKGFLEVYEEGKDQKDADDEELKNRLPLVAEGEELRFKSIEPEQHFTEPPPRFNEATLVKELEADGVGRPSTYASILSTIQEREYVKKDGGKFVPTELGMVVTDLLLENFKNLFDITYTARMEEELDEIEEGKMDWREAMSEFYERFQKDLEHAERHMTDIKRMEEPTGEICEKCGKPLVIKWGTVRKVHRLHRVSGVLQHARAAARSRQRRRPERAGRRRNIARIAAARWCSRRAASDSSMPAPDTRIARPPSRSAGSRRSRMCRSKRNARSAATTWC